MVRQVGEVSSTVSWVLPGNIRPHAMLAIVIEACKPGREGSDQFNGYLKRPVDQIL